MGLFATLRRKKEITPEMFFRGRAFELAREVRGESDRSLQRELDMLAEHYLRLALLAERSGVSRKNPT